MRVILVAAAACAVAAASPSLAADAAPFAGPYIGVKAGWGRVGGGRIPRDGFVYGINGGYDLPLGSVRIGPEVEFSDSTQKTCRAAAGRRDCERSDRDLYIGGRLGYVVSPSVLLYAKLGYTNGRFSDRPDIGGERRFNRSGVRVGGGLQYAVAGNVYVSGEYRYSHYGRDDGLGRTSGGIHQNQLLAGVGYRF